MTMRRRKWYRGFFIPAAVLVILLNLISMIPGVSDWYVVYIFPIFNNTIGRVSGLFPFSVGELLIAGGLLFVAVAAFCTVLLPFLGGRHHQYRHFVGRIYQVLLLIGVSCCLLDTLTYYMLRGCSKLQTSEKYERESQKYSVEELASLQEYLTEKCNELSQQLERDEQGRIIYSGDCQEEAKEAMHRLAGKYSRLRGYYPDAKPVLGSVFMSYTNTAGVFFNLSMEANYNRQLSVSQLPQVLCHEYAHLKGYLYEDEAEFIGYLACLESDDVLVRYSGYLSMWEYVDSACMENMEEDMYRECGRIDDTVLADTVWLDDTGEGEEPEAEWVQTTLEEHKDTIGDASRKIVDAELKLYGVSDGIASYRRVVELLLQYYDSGFESR